MKKFFGIILIIIGILGVVLPIMPGWVLIFSGLALFSSKDKKI